MADDIDARTAVDRVKRSVGKVLLFHRLPVQAETPAAGELLLTVLTDALRSALDLIDLLNRDMDTLRDQLHTTHGITVVRSAAYTDIAEILAFDRAVLPVLERALRVSLQQPPDAERRLAVIMAELDALLS